MANFTPASFNVSAFNCPHCGAYSHQQWSEKTYGYRHPYSNLEFPDLIGAECEHCHNYSLWLKEKMIYPSVGNVELPNQDLPENVLSIYNEAKSIINISPKASAALLRLALQKLMPEIGEIGKHLNTDIANLVKRGLPEHVSQALDSIRVIGNEAVHPGQIDFDDKPEYAFVLFSFINIICEYFITQPKKSESVFLSLPENIRQAIAKRDGSASTPSSE